MLIAKSSTSDAAQVTSTAWPQVANSEQGHRASHCTCVAHWASHMNQAASISVGSLVRVARPSASHGNSAAGNWTRVFRVTGGTTHRDTTTEPRNPHRQVFFIGCSACHLRGLATGRQLSAGPSGKPLCLRTPLGQPPGPGRIYFRWHLGEARQTICEPWEIPGRELHPGLPRGRRNY